ncbi:MAG: Spy/CpxP family protein refolding chaperone [Methylococcaceae bacterium]
MRKLLLILVLFPAIALAKPPMHGDYPCGDMPFSEHHRPGPGDEERMPGFLHRIDLTDKQQTEIKALLKTHRTETDAKMEAAKSIGKEIHHLVFSQDYNDDKIQTLFNKAAMIHRDTALQKSRLDNAVFKLLTAEQQKKLQSQFED